MENKPEILVISHKYPPSIGGMQKHCFELVEGVSQKTLVHRLIQTEGVSKLWFFLTVVGQARKLLLRNPNIGLIYVNDGLMAFVLTRLLKYTNVPMVVTIHGLDIVFPMAFYQKWIKTTLTKYAAIIAVSEATKNECILRGLDESKVLMVKNGYEPSAEKLLDLSLIREKLRQTYGFETEGKRIIVSIGRGVRRKGFSWFINHVITKLPSDVCYLIIGPKSNVGQINYLRKYLPSSLFEKLVLFAGLGVDELEIQQAIENHQLHERVKRISNLTYLELNALIQLADLSVMPNVSIAGDFEGFGLVALEAVSNGTLCVAAGIEGITTAIEDGKNGILLESGNAEMWKEEIETLLGDKEKLNALALQYQKYNLEHSYSWNQMVDAYFDIFVRTAKQNQAH